jgi:hypothetical protein
MLFAFGFALKIFSVGNFNSVSSAPSFASLALRACIEHQVPRQQWAG